MLPTHALALPANQYSCKKKSLRVCELGENWTREIDLSSHEDNLAIHRGRRHLWKIVDQLVYTYQVYGMCIRAMFLYSWKIIVLCSAGWLVVKPLRVPSSAAKTLLSSRQMQWVAANSYHKQLYTRAGPGTKRIISNSKLNLIKQSATSRIIFRNLKIGIDACGTWFNILGRTRITYLVLRSIRYEYRSKQQFRESDSTSHRYPPNRQNTYYSS